jgi:hypothetical protein
MKIKILLLLVSFVFVIGCATSKKTVRQGGGNAENPYDESFDPLTLNDDDIRISADGSALEAENADGQGAAEKSEEQDAAKLQRSGFRVQIAATSSLEKATLVQQEVAARFADKNLKAYLIFETPLYKVRVGNAVDRDEANSIRDFMRENGYKDSFVVPSKIIISKENADFDN